MHLITPPSSPQYANAMSKLLNEHFKNVRAWPVPAIVVLKEPTRRASTP